jgi:hypothetical protein
MPIIGYDIEVFGQLVNLLGEASRASQAVVQGHEWFALPLSLIAQVDSAYFDLWHESRPDRQFCVRSDCAYISLSSMQKLFHARREPRKTD